MAVDHEGVFINVSYLTLLLYIVLDCNKWLMLCMKTNPFATAYYYHGESEYD